MHDFRVLGLLTAVVLGLVGCGEPPSEAGSPKDRTQAALGEIFTLAQKGGSPELAALVVYRGADTARNWKAACDYPQPDEKQRVDGIAARIRSLLGEGKPAFVEWHSETESEGTWLKWRVKGVEKSAWFACLEIDDVIASGDIDNDGTHMHVSQDTPLT